MNSFQSQFKSIFLRFGLLLTLFGLFRIVFYFANYSLFGDLTVSEWTIVVVHGLRFDITALLYFNSLPLPMQVMPFPFRKNNWFQTIQKVLFVLLNTIAIVLVLTDFAFYPFNLKRLDSELLGLMGAVPTMLTSFLQDFWYLFLLLFVLIWFLMRLFDFTRGLEKAGQKFNYLKSAALFILVVGFILLGLRGGLQPRPIRPVMATQWLQPDLAPLVTNSPFTFIYSVFNRRLQPKNYYSTAEMERLFPVKKSMRPSDPPVKIQKPNIVLIILESFSASCIGHLGATKSYTPFLDSLSNKSLVFSRAYANGRRSSQGLVALTAGLPALMDDPFMYSPYLSNRIYGLPYLLKKMNYETSFFNGSDQSMLGWQDFIATVGFDNYYSRESYPYSDHYDGYWGIYDHYFMDYFIEKSKEFKSPFFSAFFSLSSHHPFHIPPSLKKRFANTSSEYYNALQYTDWALSQFFEKASKEAWFPNTVFLITADHTLYAADKSPEQVYSVNNQNINRVNLYHIPVLIYSEGLIAPARRDKVVQQLDLFDTALDIAGYEGEYYSFGQSAFEAGDGCAFQQVKGIYQYTEGDYLLLFKDGSPMSMYNYTTDPELTSDKSKEEPERVSKMSARLKAIIQQHDNTLIENNMLLK